MISAARVGAERALEHAAGEVDAALGDVVLGHRRSRRPRRRPPCRSSAGDLAGLGDLQRERLDLGLGEVAEDLAGRSSPSATSRTAAFWTPGHPLRRTGPARRGAIDAHAPRPAIHCWTWAATRSGSRSDRAASSWRSAGVGLARRAADRRPRRARASRRSSCGERASGSSISRSHAGAASASPSRLLAARGVTKNRNSSAARPRPAHLIGPSSAGRAPGPALGDRGAWRRRPGVTVIVSPRVGVDAGRGRDASAAARLTTGGGHADLSTHQRDVEAC